MLVPLKRSGQLEEWAFVELQGDLKFDTGKIENNQYIGGLNYTKTGTPIIVIGVHMLQGKEETLPKPMAVLKKKRIPVESGSSLGDNATTTEYSILAIVRKRLIFRNRPKYIIGHVPKSI